jgi:hypothetical protein
MAACSPAIRYGPDRKNREPPLLSGLLNSGFIFRVPNFVYKPDWNGCRFFQLAGGKAGLTKPSVKNRSFPNQLE